jgi:hypothetical protein
MANIQATSEARLLHRHANAISVEPSLLHENKGFFLYISLILRYVALAVVTNLLPRSRESLEHLKMTTI